MIGKISARNNISFSHHNKSPRLPISAIGAIFWGKRPGLLLLIPLFPFAEKLADARKAETFADSEAPDALVEAHAALAHRCSSGRGRTKAQGDAGSTQIDVKNTRNDGDSRVGRGAAVATSACHAHSIEVEL